MIERVLPDTHAIYWYEARSPKLSSAAKAFFDAAKRGEVTLMLHPIVLSELHMLLRKAGRSPQFMQFLRYAFSESGYESAELTAQEAVRASELDESLELHDRLIASTAMRLEVPIITVDAVLRASAQVKTIW